MSVRAAVDASLQVGPQVPRDAAAAALAQTYADEIDNDHEPCEECGCRGGGDLTKLGPALLAALEALGLTPRARKAVKSDVQQPAANALDQLADRRARKGRAG